MKKSLFVLGVAVAALASCTQNEVVDIAESNAIKFDAFVGNPTKAVTEVDNDNIKAFHVYGTKTSSTGTFFDGDEVYESETPNVWIYDDLKTWEESQTYTFAAYSNGGVKGSASTSNVEWNGSNLTIKGYNAGTEQKDLLVSIASNATSVASQNDPVQFNFVHALALIKFTIKSDLGDDNNAVKISNFTVTGINSTANLTYSSEGVAWAGHNTSQGLSCVDFSTESSTPGESESFAVIPGETNVSFTVSFTATIGDGASIPAKTLTATISNQNWTAGYRYNYVATITGADMDVITFADPEVSIWEEWGENSFEF